MQSIDFSGLKPVFGVVGANTDIGKTLVSAALAGAFAAAGRAVSYVKPWQTGAPVDCDARTVEQAVRDAFDASIETQTIVAYAQPVSPHVAARSEGLPMGDDAVVAALAAHFSAVDAQRGVAFYEGAGGVASPTPEGALQCDVFRRVRTPLVLVGDPRLGGISATLAAYETLRARGFDIPAVVFLGEGNENARFLSTQFTERGEATHTFVLEPLSTLRREDGLGGARGLSAWLRKCAPVAAALAAALIDTYETSRDANVTLAADASRTLWWPFTQHAAVSRAGVIASAYGDELHFAGEGPSFDACASWWTQSLGHANGAIGRSATYAAGRYGHVIFPGNAHEPAVVLARALLEGAGAGWAARTFYSDNGSTAVEVALKMAFRLRSSRLGASDAMSVPLRVVGLCDSYHGDTLGAMDASSPNAFNAKEPWYSGRGAWMPYPTVCYEGGQWRVTRGEAFERWLTEQGLKERPSEVALPTRSALFDPGRRHAKEASSYEAAARAFFAGFGPDARGIGALLLEPIVQGSGGMIFVDPLFQTCLALEARRLGVPVVYDEVFVGFYRLGFARAADALGVLPDIACYSKCLTGGLAPLGVTLATEETFSCFLGDDKLSALLHGHSFTAYPLGCATAKRSIEVMAASTWVSGHAVQAKQTPWAPFCVFDDADLRRLADHPGVSGAWASGTAFAFTWGAPEGYAGMRTRGVVERLRSMGVYARPLGSVLYGMTTLSTTPQKASWLMACYLEALSAKT